ncbi:hypothetical protein EMIT07CA2_10457 [Brevibacillus sp. IT-7CA2]
MVDWQEIYAKRYSFYIEKHGWEIVGTPKPFNKEGENAIAYCNKRVRADDRQSHIVHYKS